MVCLELFGNRLLFFDQILISEIFIVLSSYYNFKLILHFQSSALGPQKSYTSFYSFDLVICSSVYRHLSSPPPPWTRPVDQLRGDWESWEIALNGKRNRAKCFRRHFSFFPATEHLDMPNLISFKFRKFNLVYYCFCTIYKQYYLIKVH